MRILFTRFPLESTLGGAEIQTLSLMEGLMEHGHAVAFAGSCPVLLAECKKRSIPVVELQIGPPPVTKWEAISFTWRKQSMMNRLTAMLKNFEKLDAIIMLSVSEKLLLTDIAADAGTTVVWVEHDRIGRWLRKNPWLPLLLKQSHKATTVAVSELSRRMYVEMGWPEERVVAIANGVRVRATSPSQRNPSPDKTSPIPSPSPARGREREEREYKVKPQVNGLVLQHAREMRKNPTKAEEYLWKFLRFDQLGVRFRRQHPVRGRILDFYCDKAKLGIEVDGLIHDDPIQKENDAIRTDEMDDEGIEIIRFTNEEVLHDIENVLHSIQSYLCSPPLAEEGLGVGEVLRIGCIARLSPEKGVDVLIRAMSTVPETITLEIIGTGREEQNLRHLAYTLELDDRVTFTPHESNVTSAYVRFDALVLPSRDHDPFGMVAAEAMFAGLPVIVTDACGIAGYLRNDADAIVVTADSSSALTEAITRIQNLEFRIQITKEGRKTAEEKFSVEKMVNEYEKLCTQNNR